MNKNILYVGGDFCEIGGEVRHCIAAIDANTGKLTSWSAKLHDNGFGIVNSIAINGNILYAGGNFYNFDGMLCQHNIAAFDISTGNLINWKVDAENDINSIVVSDDRIYLGGSFQKIEGQARRYLAQLKIYKS